MSNADFDGDELWTFVRISTSSMAEARAEGKGVLRYDVIYGSVEYVPENAYENAKLNVIPTLVDPAMLTTITLDKMSEHPGKPIYESMMLKPKSWRTMYKTMTSANYWRKHVIRSEAGIVDVTTSRRGLAGTYGFGIMLASCVVPRGDIQ